MKKLLFSAAIMMIVTSPALAGDAGSGDCKGCNSSAYQEVFGPPDVPTAAYPRFAPGAVGRAFSDCHLVKERVGTRHGHALYQTRQVCG
jgi:hypothetical protein